MMRGYKCQKKKAKEILETLGFDPKAANRGWVMLRTGGRNHKGAPERMHALINTDRHGFEYIDIHADHAGPNETHISSRKYRSTRWLEIFEQIDLDQPCNAGYKLLNHYAGLRHALKKYEQRRTI